MPHPQHENPNASPTDPPGITPDAAVDSGRLTRSAVSIDGLDLPLYAVNTLIIGSGSAGLNAALQLLRRGQSSVAIVTERWGAGASYEAGSDKQTYYKLSLAHDAVDSPRRMAEDLVSGGCMHGDIALCEAHHSAQSFYHLVSCGVPFPHDEYGAYVGYRTDHDPAGRATSAGPLTSRLMCDCLARALRREDIPCFDEHQVIALLTRDTPRGRAVCGALAIHRQSSHNGRFGLVLFNAANVILATGGPGGMYEHSVYPADQSGAIGLALAIGAVAQNLTESQFGIAAAPVRWNLSGSYQQAIPRYVSTDADGGDAREFLDEFFPDIREFAAAIFRKGYEWPFDCEKISAGGSSLIDLLVYRETIDRGRRVWLDFTRNPSAGSAPDAFSPEHLPDEAKAYLENCGALLPTPIERLRAMNEPACEFFRSRGIDLAHQPLEIAVCAQHNNGGLRANTWWESNIRHLFPIGEVNGTHGVRRPGGAALNAGQVGGIRAALFIASRYADPPSPPDEFAARAGRQIRRHLDLARKMLARPAAGAVDHHELLRDVRQRMSACAGIVREPSRVARATADAWTRHEQARHALAARSPAELPDLFRALDLCLTHAVYLEALNTCLVSGAASRGSAIVLDPQGESPHPSLADRWRFAPAHPWTAAARPILEIHLDDHRRPNTRWVDPRPIPADSPWFENVWRDFREDRVVR